MKTTSLLGCLVAGTLIYGDVSADPLGKDPQGLAFVSIRDNNPHIYLKNGKHPEQPLTRGPGANTGPTWSPDGKRLAFTSTRDGLSKIFVMNADGSGQERLTKDDRIEYGASWSPDGRHLVFFSSPKDTGAKELRILNLASGTLAVVAGNGRDKGPSSPTWSADGGRIAFTGTDDKGKSQVWIVERDGSGLREVSSRFSERNKAFAALSPDGKRVAYIADMRGGADLIVTDLQTGGSKNLTANGTAAKHESPQWSRDGTQLVFASTRGDENLVRMDIFVMQADGSGMRNLSRHPHEDYDPRWSANGRSIYFTSLRTGSAQMYEVDLQSGKTERLTASISHDMEPCPRPMASVLLQRAVVD